MGKAGRERAVTEFSWTTIAAQTAQLYASLVPGGEVAGDASAAAGDAAPAQHAG